MTSKLQHPYNTRDHAHSSRRRARFPCRIRRRVTLLSLAAAFALSTLLYYSHQFLGEKYPHPSPQLQACQSLDPPTSCKRELQVHSPRQTFTITQTATITQIAPSPTETVVIAPPLEPVVFSLIMVSESAADEGTFLLKVSYWTFLFRNIEASCNKVS